MIRFIITIAAIGCIIWVGALLISVGLAMLVLSERFTKWICKRITIKINSRGKYYEKDKVF